VKGRIRWAILTALLSVALAVALGIAALTYSDEEDAGATTPGPVEGNYAFAATTMAQSVATLTNGGTEVLVTGGRLSIGADNHTFWSLTLHSTRDASRTGRLTCEGTYDRTASAIIVAPRFGYSGFAPDLDRREIQTVIANLFCSGAGLEGVDSRPVEVLQEGPLLVLKGRAGTISWRPE
jgi:hypothetical protein